MYNRQEFLVSVYAAHTARLRNTMLLQIQVAVNQWLILCRPLGIPRTRSPANSAGETCFAYLLHWTIPFRLLRHTAWETTLLLSYWLVSRTRV